MKLNENLIATDDREIERVHSTCNHRRCPPGECQAYTKETLTPTDADHQRAVELVAEGWRSTSSKYRHIIRWKVQPPGAEYIIRPEMLGTPAGKKLADYYEQYVRYNFGPTRYCPVTDNEHLVDRAMLSPSLFRAFKKAGGRCA